jgi:uncharacterized iron-regulated protein
LTVEQNIVKNALAFQTNDTFPFLDEIAETKSVIILGEESHYYLDTHEVQTKMIKYLINKGFHAAMIESYPFLSSYVSSNPAYREITKMWNKKYITPNIVSGSSSLQQMILNGEITQYGMDIDVCGYYDTESARLILSKYAVDKTLEKFDWYGLYDFYVRKFILHVALSTAEQFELMRMIDTLSNYTRYIVSKNGNNTDLKAIMQWVRTLNTAFSYFDSYALNTTLASDHILYLRNRDTQMAENILWFTENFPKEKLIVVCANFHGAKDISQTQYPTDSLLYFTFQSMGEGLSAKLGDKLYVMAITSGGEGSGRLELEIANTTGNTPFAFINFEPLRFAEGYRDQKFECNFIMKKTGKWLYMFDGVYYIRDQRSTYPESQKEILTDTSR